MSLKIIKYTRKSKIIISLDTTILIRQQCPYV